MQSNSTLERGKLLYEQSRYALAIGEFQQVLAQDPDDTQALYFQAHSLLHLDRHQEALAVANTLLGLIPGEPIALELKASVLMQLNQLTEALALIEEAIEQDPTEESYWATASTIHYERKDFDKALAAAEEGLALDPGNLVCRNFRMLCLNKLGRADEVAASVEETLAEDPDNAFSHASAGWALLEADNHKQARVHFGEALRLEPGMDWARGGMLEAIKAKSVFFRLFLRYSFWIGQQKNQNQWLFIFGVGFVLRLMRRIPDPTGIISIVRVLLIAFIWLTWFIDPIFNVLMLADSDGRHVLTDRQRDRYRYVAALLGVGVPAALIGYFTLSSVGNDLPALFISGLILLGLALPLSAWTEVDLPKNRSRLRLVFWIMATTAALAIVTMPFSTTGMLFAVLFAVEMVLFMLLRNYLSIHEQD